MLVVHIVSSLSINLNLKHYRICAYLNYVACLDLFPFTNLSCFLTIYLVFFVNSSIFCHTVQTDNSYLVITFATIPPKFKKLTFPINCNLNSLGGKITKLLCNII